MHGSRANTQLPVALSPPAGRLVTSELAGDEMTSPCSVALHSGARLAPNWKTSAVCLFWGLLLFQLAYPWWPLKPTANENDALRISLGVAQQVYDVVPTPPYRYESQSGTYQAIAWFCRLSPWAIEPLLGFRILTIVSFLAFACAATQLLHNWLGYQKWFCFLSLLLFQEAYVASYFPNSNMLAIAGGLGALALVAKKTSWQRSCLAGVLYGIGIWMRFDLVLICLTFPVVMKPLTRQAWYQVGLVTLTSVCVSLGLLWSQGINLSSILASYRQHTDNFVNPVNTLWMYATLITALLAVSIGCGLGRLWLERSWQLIALVIAGFLPTVFAFGFTVTTPKYLLYSLVFLAIASTSGLWWLLHSAGKVGKVTVMALFLCQYVANPFLYSTSGGTQFTHDGQRRLGSLCLATIDWHNQNKRRAAAVERIHRFLLNRVGVIEENFVVVQDYSLCSLAPYELLIEGYKLHSQKLGDQFVVSDYRKVGQRLTLINIDANRQTKMSSTEFDRLGIAMPARIQILGNLAPDMLPLGVKTKTLGKGKFGSYVAEFPSTSTTRWK